MPSGRAVIIGGERFVLDVAADPATRFQGLSDRTRIPRRGGMLFVYPSPRPLQFVMRRCLVPLDLLLVDGSGVIVSVHEMRVEPYDTADADLPRYGSPRPVPYAIELRGGTIRELGLAPGQRVDLGPPPLPAS
jgi:uncharacterized membrane protein (UPF0127 family)